MTSHAIPSYATLNGIPTIDIQTNLGAAMRAGRRTAGIVREIIALRRGSGTLSPQEYFYYRLWDRRLPQPTNGGTYVGKMAQHAMHIAANGREWYATAADKILFQSIMDGAGPRTPQLLAITQAGRYLPRCPTVTTPAALAELLRDPACYPLFAKPVQGKYSLGVVSAESYDRRTDEVVLLGGEQIGTLDLAASLVGGAGYLIQRRLTPAPELAKRFGPRLWSARLLVLMTPDGPVVHRAVAKIATGANPADNYWRPGNLIGAIDLATGRITRAVTGTGAALTVIEHHPDTGAVLSGTAIPRWSDLTGEVERAARVFAGIRTQSWDIALSSDGPVFLELNFGGDLNLHQLAHGAGVLDERFRAHMRACGYRRRL